MKTGRLNVLSKLCLLKILVADVDADLTITPKTTGIQDTDSYQRELCDWIR